MKPSALCCAGRPQWHDFGSSCLYGDRKGKKMKATRSHSELGIRTQLLKIGLEVFPVYGDEKVGWSVDAGDLYPQMPPWFRYRSIDELFFALVNLNISPEGQA
jgi:hypothetical protein